MKKLLCMSAALLFGFLLCRAGDRQIVKGNVMDAETGEPLIGAAVIVCGTSDGVITDLDGNFEMAVDADSLSVEVSYIGYRTKTVTISGNAEDLFRIFLEQDGQMLDNAVVTGRKNLESLQALRNERIGSGHAIENIGSKEMSIKGISDAQEGVVKLSGISVADAGQLIVRGLGDRYSTTTLNGLPIASPNPDNKLIPLDIFPASTIQNITVSKVYEAGAYADYSGAHVDISTKEGRTSDFFTASVATGGYFRTLASGFRRMDNRSLFITPSPDPEAENIPYSEFSAYSKGKDIFGTSFTTRNVAVIPDISASLGWGKTLSLGGRDFSVLATGSLKSADETILGAFYRTYEASSTGSLRSNYDYDSYTRKLNLAALLNLNYELSASDNVGVTVFFARNAKDTHLDREGYDYLETYELTGRNQVSHYYKLQNYQVSGHHRPGDGWEMDWGLSYSITSSDEPDRRQVMFRRLEDGSLTFFDLNQQETQRYFGFLDENEAAADLKAVYDFDENNSIGFGLSGRYKTRTFETTRYYYNLKQFDGTIEDPDNMDDLLGFGQVASGQIGIDRKKHKRDNYDAFNLIGAAFVEADLKFSDRWSLNAGVRLECSRQSVDYNDDVADMTRNLDALDLFPAINLRYDLSQEHIFRLSLSKTVTRPSFIEMAPFLYQESFGGAQIRGNEYLENGYNYNADLKYEYFRSASEDMFAVTGYFKYLETPIERTQRLSGGATEHSFQNADNGLAAGVEVEIRKTVVRNLVFSANASYMYTNVVLPQGGVYTNAERSLQGASPYLVNADLSYTPEFRNGSSLALAILYNLQGPRIQSVGIMGLGDVTQLPVHTLDFNCTYSLNSHLSLKMSFRNLLDSEIHMIQDIPNADNVVDVERWKLGRGMEIGISYTL